MTARAWTALPVAAALLAACGGSAVPEGGVASSSLCADSYLLTLAPERASMLSWQAGGRLSTASDAAARLPRLYPDRERLHGLDAVHIGGPAPTTPPADVTLDWGEDFATVARNAERVQAAVGGDERRLQALLADIASLNAKTPDGPRPRILYLSRAGGSAGAGTFVDAAITAAGGENAAGAPGWHTPSVESVLASDADIVLTSFFGSDYHGANDRARRHAAIGRFMADRPRIDVPGKLWPCAGPGLVEATALIRDGIADWKAARG